MDGILIGGAPNPTTFGQVRTEGIVDPTYGAQRVVLKPSEYNFGGFQGGHYRVARVVAGVTGFGAAALMLSFRWTLPTAEALIKRVTVGVGVTTAFTAGQVVDFDLIKSTGFTASDTGGTAVSLASGTNKLRTKWMNTSQVADFREAAAAAIVAGTKTFDTSPIGQGTIAAGPTGATSVGLGGMIDLYKEDAVAEHPFMLTVNEGFNVRLGIALGAAGVIRFSYIVEWAEVPGL
jgi:hypothetical protein